MVEKSTARKSQGRKGRQSFCGSMNHICSLHPRHRSDHLNGHASSFPKRHLMVSSVLSPEPPSTYWSALLFLLSHGPYTLNAKGIGIMTAARQPRRVQAHCTPMFSNICREKSGNPAATEERIMMLAATVDAALFQPSQLLSDIIESNLLRLTAADKRRRDS